MCTYSYATTYLLLSSAHVGILLAGLPTCVLIRNGHAAAVYCPRSCLPFSDIRNGACPLSAAEKRGTILRGEYTYVELQPTKGEANKKGATCPPHNAVVMKGAGKNFGVLFALEWVPLQLLCDFKE